ncbi:MAG: TnsA endonuclease N-terminal domain-containing protein [Anaerolineae bacterium]|nr:TnsA endonuclease N-terminal domain-containing protein [Anaerolineae bacterium]
MIDYAEQEENMAVRKVSNRGGNIVGHFPSLKLGRMVAFESLIERDFIYLLDYDPGVEHFAEQPLTIQYHEANKKRRYTPDFHVIYRGQPFLCECKPAQFVADPQNQIKFAAARLCCQKQGWAFAVVTDAQLATGWRIANIKLLTQFARYVIGAETKGRVFAFLAAVAGPVTVADVMQGVNPAAPQAVAIPILHMAFHHQVHIPLDDAKISVNSPITLANPARERQALLP